MQEEDDQEENKTNESSIAIASLLTKDTVKVLQDKKEKEIEEKERGEPSECPIHPLLIIRLFAASLYVRWISLCNFTRQF